LSLNASFFLLAFHLFIEFVVLIDGSLNEDVTAHQHTISMLCVYVYISCKCKLSYPKR